MQKALMALQSSLKSIIVKAGNQFSDSVSNFTQNQKIQNKNKHCVYFKRKLIYNLYSKSKSLHFTFDLKRELHSSSFSVLATKSFHITGPRVCVFICIYAYIEKLSKILGHVKPRFSF